MKHMSYVYYLNQLGTDVTNCRRDFIGFMLYKQKSDIEDVVCGNEKMVSDDGDFV